MKIYQIQKRKKLLDSQKEYRKIGAFERRKARIIREMTASESYSKAVKNSTLKKYNIKR
jgi:hypothetical protein